MKPTISSLELLNFPFTFTGWKNSSITVCALESSEDELTPPEGNEFASGWLLTPELLLGPGAWRLGCRLRGTPGVLISLHVKITATASPAIAQTDRISCNQISGYSKYCFNLNYKEKKNNTNLTQMIVKSIVASC